MGIRRDFLRTIEAGIMGWFLFQAIRFLYGTLYAHVSSADLTRRVADQTPLVDLLGYIELNDARREIYAILIALLAPLLALFIARIRWSIPLAVALAAVGRMLALMVPDSAALAAAMVVGAGMLYMALVIMRRPNHFPTMLLLGGTLDQFVRATGTTIDPTWNPDNVVRTLGYSFPMDNFFIGLAIFMVLLAGYTTLSEIEFMRLAETSEKRGTLTGWSSLALGAFLFMELTLFGLANAVAGWADVPYHYVVVPLLVMTVLPLVPEVRRFANAFIGSFIGAWRGWIWMLLIGLLLVLGQRFPGTFGLVVLLIAQLMICLAVWWFIRIRDEIGTANPTPILMLIALFVFAMLSAGDYFTYNYAYVRPIAPPFARLEDVLKSMRDFGLQLFIFATVLLGLPMILERRIVPWRGGREGESLITGLFVIALAFGTTRVIEPRTVFPPARPNCFRVATLNVHSGYTLLFQPNVERIAEAIQLSGADIVLLQEVDRGLLSSFGVDQATWLARELNMNMTFFPQNEFLQGLVVLSRMPINESFGEKLPSTGAQAGLQHVVLNFQGQPLHIYNLWLGFRLTDANGLPLPENQQDQNRQIDQVRRIIAANHAPAFADRLIMGGTFNYDETSNLYKLWNETTFKDPFVGLDQTRDIKTIFLVDGTSARFDYIWLMNMIANSPNGVGIDQKFVVSDHRLAVAEVILDPNKTCEGSVIPQPTEPLPEINNEGTNPQ